MQQRGGEREVGRFTSLVIWEGFQGEVAAELNPTEVRLAPPSSDKGISEQPFAAEYFTHFQELPQGYRGD